MFYKILYMIENRKVYNDCGNNIVMVVPNLAGLNVI